MDNQFHIQAQPRVHGGKANSRRDRHANRIPGIIYGGKDEPMMIWMDEKTLSQTLSHEAVHSHILTVKIEGQKTSESVVLKQMQTHASYPRVLHCDFLRVNARQAITLSVPVHYGNEDTNEILTKKLGILSKHLDHLDVQCLPGDLPEYLSVDVANLTLDGNIHLSDLTLPKGVTLVALAHDNDMAVVSLHPPKVAPVEEEDAPAATEGTDAESADDKDTTEENTDS